jgi:hypothetical protein
MVRAVPLRLHDLDLILDVVIQGKRLARQQAADSSRRNQLAV